MVSERQLDDQHDRERSRLLDADTTSVRLDGEPTKVQAEPQVRAAAVVARSTELLEDARALLHRDRLARVADTHDEAVADDAGCDLHAAALRCVTERVVDQVFERPREEIRVHAELDVGTRTYAQR